MWLFRSVDRRTLWVDNQDADLLAQYIDKMYLDAYDADNPLKLLIYQCSADMIRDRLDLKGFTYEHCKLIFQARLESEVKKYRRWREHYPSEVWDQTLTELNSLTLDKWARGIRQIVLGSSDIGSCGGSDPSGSQSTVLRRMLRASSELYGFPGGLAFAPENLLPALRVILEHVPSNEVVTYDLSDLEGGGWVDDDDDPAEMVGNLLYTEAWLTEKVIVLTEGETDKRFLERSLGLLYPHLVDYFRFFEHSATKSGGGAGQLANLVRAFAALDVRQRIIAVFDNDTAAREALSTLAQDQLPSNIAVVHYPDCEIARDYPTLGPTGLSRMNVNGLAASIELYLGEDVLSDESETLSPVQWTGYSTKLGCYQGEVLGKQRIQERFAAKITCCEERPENIWNSDWDGIIGILDVLRSAFHDSDKELLMEIVGVACDLDE